MSYTQITQKNTPAHTNYTKTTTMQAAVYMAVFQPLILIFYTKLSRMFFSTIQPQHALNNSAKFSIKSLKYGNNLGRRRSPT